MKKHLLSFLIVWITTNTSQATLVFNNTQYLFTQNWPANSLFDLDGDGVKDIQLRGDVNFTTTTVAFKPTVMRNNPIYLPQWIMNKQ